MQTTNKTPKGYLTEEQIRGINEKQYLTLKEAALLLNISALTLRKWTLGGKMRGNKKNKNLPYDFIDMSVTEPYDEKWKTNCRARIRNCSGAIAVVSKKTKNASCEIWEIDCVKDEKIPLLGIYITEQHF